MAEATAAKRKAFPAPASDVEAQAAAAGARGTEAGDGQPSAHRFISDPPAFVLEGALACLLPTDCASAAGTNKAWRAAAERDEVWRAYLANDASTRPILEALDQDKRKGLAVISYKSLYVKAWSATNAKVLKQKEPKSEDRHKGQFLRLQIMDPRSGRTLGSAAAALDDKEALKGLFAWERQGAGVKVPLAPGVKSSDVKGCTAVITFLDLKANRSARICTIRKIKWDTRSYRAEYWNDDYCREEVDASYGETLFLVGHLEDQMYTLKPVLLVKWKYGEDEQGREWEEDVHVSWHMAFTLFSCDQYQQLEKCGTCVPHELVQMLAEHKEWF